MAISPSGRPGFVLVSDPTLSGSTAREIRLENLAALARQRPDLFKEGEVEAALAKQGGPGAADAGRGKGGPGVGVSADQGATAQLGAVGSPETMGQMELQKKLKELQLRKFGSSDYKDWSTEGQAALDEEIKGIQAKMGSLAGVGQGAGLAKPGAGQSLGGPPTGAGLQGTPTGQQQQPSGPVDWTSYSQVSPYGALGAVGGWLSGGIATGANVEAMKALSYSRSPVSQPPTSSPAGGVESGGLPGYTPATGSDYLRALDNFRLSRGQTEFYGGFAPGVPSGPAGPLSVPWYQPGPFRGGGGGGSSGGGGGGGGGGAFGGGGGARTPSGQLQSSVRPPGTFGGTGPTPRPSAADLSAQALGAGGAGPGGQDALIALALSQGRAWDTYLGGALPGGGQFGGVPGAAPGFPPAQGGIGTGGGSAVANPTYDQLMAAYGQAHGAVTGGYQNLFNQATGMSAQGYNEALQQVFNTNQGLLGGYRNVLGETMGQVDQLGAARAQEIRDAYAAQQGATQQSMISRGLGNTTVTDAARRGLTIDQQKALNENTERLAAIKAGYVANLGQNYLGQAERLGTGAADLMRGRGQAGADIAALYGLPGMGYLEQSANRYFDLAQMFGATGGAGQFNPAANQYNQSITQSMLQAGGYNARQPQAGYTFTPASGAPVRGLTWDQLMEYSNYMQPSMGRRF
jgi:hypothetical protein